MSDVSTSSLDSVDEPRAVGPYRVETRLGQGGMGEVWAGYDDRLDRPVALKRVRSAGERDTGARDRLHREARAAARLQHPALVQVYDWVETSDGDWIVMERVEGSSLRHLLRQGPLEPARAIRLALDILGGLAVAHASGIVHRDLKPANVMLAADSAPGKGEQAKVLDFGIAKRFDPDTGESLSVDGPAMGTLSAMSPEQIRGLRVDPRSDLFSLGSLLYEMISGRQPFLAGSPAETLRRICTWEPPDLHTEVPAVGEELSAFVGRLLAKDFRARPASAESAFAELESILERMDPREDTWLQTLGDLETLDPAPFVPAAEAPDPGRPRWRSFLRGAVALGLVLLVAAGLTWGWQRGRPPLYVAVPATESALAGDGGAVHDLELAASAVRTSVLRGLLGFRRLVVVEPAVGSPAEPRQLARATAADEVFTSRLECAAASCRLTLARIRGSDGRLLWTQGFPIESGQLLEVSRAVVDHLRGAYPERRLRAGVPELEVRAGDYQEFLQLKRRFDRREAGFSLDDLLAELQTLSLTSPRFLELPFLEAHVSIRYFQETRSDVHLERARAALARAEVLAPTDPRVLYERINVARISGETEEAERVLATLRRQEPGNVRGLYQQARLLEGQGQTEEALGWMARAIERLPAASLYFDYGGMLARAGEVERAREALERGLERDPGHYNGRSRLAQLELMSGSPARAAELYQELVERSPESTELINLGTARLLIGEYEASVESFRAALDLSPGFPAALLNLADAEYLSGDEEAAAGHYAEVLTAVAGDSDPERWATVRAQALAHLGRTPEAIAAVQVALRRQPEDPMVAFEASLVFTLVGDAASATWHGRRALQQGVDSRWFGFPWFDGIRTDLESTGAPNADSPGS